MRIPKSKAPVNEVVLTGDDIDLTAFPSPKFWPGDGGRYIGTGDITLTASPDTGRINVGCYRQMLHGPRRVGLYCSPGKHGGLDREAWWKQGKPCEVVVAYGIDPVLFMLAAQVFGSKESEFDVAGGMMGRGIELTDGETVSLPIPAHAELVIEGVVHEGDVLPEGPLGEFTGYYGRERSPQPVIEVKAVHHRKSPILTAALMAKYPSCEIGAYYAIMRSARILDDLERIGVPGVVGAYAHPAAASGWGIVVVSLQQQYAGHAAQVLALAAQCPAAAYYTKWIIAVDDDVDPTDWNEVLWALSTRCHPSEDIDILKKTWSTGLDPSQFEMERRPYGSKALIDAFLGQDPASALYRSDAAYLTAETLIALPVRTFASAFTSASAVAKTLHGLARPELAAFADRRAAEADRNGRSVRPVGDLAGLDDSACIFLARHVHRHIEIDLLAPRCSLVRRPATP